MYHHEENIVVCYGDDDRLGAQQGSPFCFYCSEFRFSTFRTEIRFPVSSGNGKNDRNFGLSDRNGEPC